MKTCKLCTESHTHCPYCGEGISLKWMPPFYIGDPPICGECAERMKMASSFQQSITIDIIGEIKKPK